jgi:hypothetical protein
MCTGTDDVREIIQLWHAAIFYYRMLPNLSANEMNMTVRDWSSACELKDDFHQEPMFEFCCHIASCAIRLYSIDEKRKHKRYTDYQAWWKGTKSLAAFSEYELRCIVHCILRNVVAHNEKKGERHGSYNELKNHYFGLSIRYLYEGMKEVISSIALDLKS